MSRYFQQLARHAGISPTASPGLPRPALAPPAKTEVVEEIVEHDAGPRLSAPSDPSTISSSTSPLESADKIQAPVSVPACVQPSSFPVVDPKISAPAGEPDQPDSEIAGRQGLPNPEPQSSLSSAALLQQVIAWIAEAERPGDSDAAVLARDAHQKKDDAPTIIGPPAAVAPPLPGVVEISPGFSRRPPRDVVKEISAPAESKTPPAQRTLAVAARVPAAPPVTAMNASSGNAADEFHVTIGSIHLTVEAPPVAAPSPAAAPRAAQASPTPAPAPSPFATRARRHYLRSIN